MPRASVAYYFGKDITESVLASRQLLAGILTMPRKTKLDSVEPSFGTGSNAPIEPRTLERSLGARIRSMRREHDLSVLDLASASNISAGMLSKIENGQISPSLSSLQAIANALTVSLSMLFAATEERRDCSFVRARQGVIIERRDTKVGHVYQLLGHVIGGDVVVEPYLITLREEAEAFTGFQHSGIEFIYMLTGEVMYRHGEKSYRLRPEDSILFDSGALHGPQTLIKVPAIYLSIIVYARKQS
jgi:transcriptional regulator with XRE-family HTH domain